MNVQRPSTAITNTKLGITNTQSSIKQNAIEIYIPYIVGGVDGETARTPMLTHCPPPNRSFTAVLLFFGRSNVNPLK